MGYASYWTERRFSGMFVVSLIILVDSAMIVLLINIHYCLQCIAMSHHCLDLINVSNIDRERPFLVAT